MTNIQKIYNSGEDSQHKLFSYLKSFSLKMDFLEQKLAQCNFIVGYGATLADLSIACCFYTPLKQLYNIYFAWKYPNLTGYLERINSKFRLGKLPQTMTTLNTSINEMENKVGVTYFANFERDLKLGKFFEEDTDETESVDRLGKSRSFKNSELKKKSIKKFKKGNKKVNKDKDDDGKSEELSSSCEREEKPRKHKKVKDKRKGKNCLTDKKKNKKKQLSRSSSSSSSSSSSRGRSSSSDDSSSRSDSSNRKMKKLRKKNKKLEKKLKKIKKQVRKMMSSSSSESSQSRSSSDSPKPKIKKHHKKNSSGSKKLKKTSVLHPEESNPV